MKVDDYAEKYFEGFKTVNGMDTYVGRGKQRRYGTRRESFKTVNGMDTYVGRCVRQEVWELMTREFQNRKRYGYLRRGIQHA